MLVLNSEKKLYLYKDKKLRKKKQKKVSIFFKKIKKLSIKKTRIFFKKPIVHKVSLFDYSALLKKDFIKKSTNLRHYPKIKYKRQFGPIPTTASTLFNQPFIAKVSKIFGRHGHNYFAYKSTVAAFFVSLKNFLFKSNNIIKMYLNNRVKYNE